MEMSALQLGCGGLGPGGIGMVYTWLSQSTVYAKGVMVAQSNCGFHPLLDLFPAVFCMIVSFLQTPHELELSRTLAMSLANPFLSLGRKANEWRESKGPQDLGMACPHEKISVDLADMRLGHLDNCPASRLIPESWRKLSRSSLVPSPNLGN